MRNRVLLPSVSLTLLALSAAACSGSRDEDAAGQELALVSDLHCSVARGAFVARSSATDAGEVAVQCPGASRIAFNGEAVSARADAFAVKPREGINVLHVEKDEGAETRTTDIPFLFGTFNDERAVVPNAVVVRVGTAGLSSGGSVALPLPAGPTPLNLSQVASQVLRDQGNLLGRLDGTKKSIGGFGFSGSVKVVRSSYDHRNVTVVVTPRAGGVHLEATMSSVSSLVSWEASVVGLDILHDQIDASIGKVKVSADVDLAYDAATKGIRPTLGAHDIRVENVELDSAALGRIPFGLADGLEDAIASGAEALINRFADPLLDLVKDRVLPKLSVSLDQFKLPSRLDVPYLGGSVDIAQSFDGAAFQGNGLSVSLGAGVFAPPQVNGLAAPGWFSRPSGAASFDSAKAFGASLSLDYVNQALFAVWKQGLLNRKLSGPVSQFGISTEDIFSNAKLPPIVLPAPDGSGVYLNVGELELTTVFHSTTAGDAKVKLAVTLLAGAKIALTNGGETLEIKPSGDETQTKFVAELVGVAEGKKEAATELAGILSLFTPYLETVIAHDLDLPPIAIPAIDLGIVSPAFAGRMGRFDGAIKFDAAASRVALEGKVVAH
jgi:hypothetical protein